MPSISQSITCCAAFDTSAILLVKEVVIFDLTHSVGNKNMTQEKSIYFGVVLIFHSFQTTTQSLD